MEINTTESKSRELIDAFINVGNTSFFCFYGELYCNGIVKICHSQCFAEHRVKGYFWGGEHLCVL